MPDIDQLSIQIESDSHKAEDAINSLVRGLENLNTALGNLDVSKITSFTNAVNKLSNIGVNTNATSKAIKSMATDIAKSFGIRTKQGIEDISAALQEMYEASRQNAATGNNQMGILNAENSLHRAIKTNYRYVESADEVTKAVREYVDAFNKGGGKVGMGSFKYEFGDDFKYMQKVLGSGFKNTAQSTKQGYLDLANFLTEMNEVLGTNFNDYDPSIGLKELVTTLEQAKDKVLDYNEAAAKGAISDTDLWNASNRAMHETLNLLSEMSKQGTVNGLGGVISAFQQISRMTMPDMTGVADALKTVQRNSADVGSSASKVDDVAKTIDNVATSAQNATSQVNELANSLMVVSNNYALMKTNDNTSITVFDKMLPALREVSAFQPPDISTAIEQFEEWSEYIYRALSGMRAITDKRKGLPDKYYDPIDTTGQWVENNPPDLYTAVDKYTQMAKAADGAREATDKLGDSIKRISMKDTFWQENTIVPFEEGLEKVKQSAESMPKDPLKGTTDSANAASRAIQQAINDMIAYKKIMSDMESGKEPFFDDTYREAYKGFNDAKKVVDNFKESLEEKKPTTFMADVVPQLIALGEGLEKLAGKFGALGDKGIKLFKGLTTPLKWFASEYVEKFESMKANLDGFRKHFEKSLNKMSQFWKRTMKTFTFMLVRKAITAIIKEVGTAVQSLALYSNAMGTAFNKSISLMVADFQYLGRSIVSAFAPVINYFAPMIDYMVDKIAELISYVGMLFAALTGASTFTRAKKTVDNYAESLDDASKKAKNLTMGIDELNILNDNKSSSSKAYDGWEDAWEEVDVPDWIKELSEKIKGVWDGIFNPLEKAWNKAKNQVMNGFKTMRNSLKTLFGDIGEDFLEVWNQDETIFMFEKIFKIVGDLERTVRNLADGFDDAWTKADVGKRILENLRDIASIIVDHARNVSYYMSEWAKSVDFSPILKAFEELTEKLKPLADFIGGVFEDVFKVILEYIKFLIEEDIPHLMHTISGIVDAFNFKDLQEKLQPVWDAFEKLFENISIGATNALGALGRELANFTGSTEFENFLKRISEVASLFTADRIEKVLTGLGEGILKIAEALVKFVNSDVFIKFLQAIAEWIDKESTEQIASILEKIAFAIVGFKFGEFALDKLSGFFQFFTVITAIKNLGTIAGDLGHLSGRITDVSTASKGLTIGSLATDFETFGQKIKNIPSAVGSIGTKFLELHNHIGLIPQLLGGAVTAFLEFKNVEKNVEDLTKTINGQGDASLGGSILSLIGTVGAASAAFTALLGFPAGIIAAGCVAAVGAIKGILDGVEEVRRVVDEAVIYNAVMTEGEMTVEEVGKWYDQITEKIFDSVDKWKEKERTLTQDREDINEYTTYIQGLTSALDEYGKVTLGLSGDLVGTYKNLENAIDDYIDSSTDAIKMNLLSQKAYLEAQGYDVNKMIRDLYDTSQAQKDAVHDAVNGIDEAEKKLKEAVEKFGEDSAEAEAAQRAFNDACDAAAGTISQYSDVVGKVDTSEAVKQIEALGKSIDYSQYGSPEEAIAEVKKGIDNVTAAYTEGMAGLKDKQQSEIAEWNRQFAKGMIDEATKNANIEATNRTFGEMQDELTTATQGVLDLYQKDLVNKINSVAQNAAAEWEKDGGELSGLSKAAYVQKLTQEFLDKTLGKDGLEGSINKLYEALPGNVNNNAVTAMQGIVNNQWDAYTKANQGGFINSRDEMHGMLQGILDESKKLDYDTPASTFASSQMEAYNKHLTQSDYNSLGQLFNNSAGGALLSNKQIFTDKNKLVANEGAAAFSQEYRDFLSNNKETIDALGKTGNTYGKSIVDGLNEAIEKNADSTKSFTNKWFEKINNFIHDNVKMPFGSPNKKTIEYGKEMVEGLNNGVKDNADTSKDTIVSWFTKIDETIKEQMDKINADFNDTWNKVFKFDKVDVKGHINTLFKSLTDEVTSQLSSLSSSLSNDKLPRLFKETIEPYSTKTKWQTVLDNLLNNVLKPYFSDLKSKFQNFMKSWWTDDVEPYFVKDKWNNLIKTVVDVAESQWKTFSTNWKKDISDWWNNDVVPNFAESKWKTEFTHVRDAAKNVFDEIKKIIKDTFDEISKSTSNTFSGLKSSLSTALDDMSKTASTKFGEIKKTLETACTEMNTSVTSKFGDIKKTIETSCTGIDTTVSSKFGDVKKSIEDICDEIAKSVSSKFDDIEKGIADSCTEMDKAISTSFDSYDDTAETVFSTVYKTITGYMEDVSKNVVSYSNDMVTAISDVIDKLKELNSDISDIGGSDVVVVNSLTKYATGGFPEYGSLFMAGESGAGVEMVGNVGGRTGVVSNNEITGIADAVYATGNQESDLLGQLVAITQALLDKDPVVLNDKDIALMANKGRSRLGMSIIT